MRITNFDIKFIFGIILYIMLGLFVAAALSIKFWEAETEHIFSMTSLLFGLILSNRIWVFLKNLWIRNT